MATSGVPDLRGLNLVQFELVPWRKLLMVLSGLVLDPSGTRRIVECELQFSNVSRCTCDMNMVIGTELVEIKAVAGVSAQGHQAYEIRFKTGVVTVVAERMATSFLQDVPFSVFDERVYQDQLSRR
jgi:hypothetical protein